MQFNYVSGIAKAIIEWSDLIVPEGERLLEWVDASSVKVPANRGIKVGERMYLINSDQTINWSDLDTGSEEIGMDYYVYACVSQSGLTFKISKNSTYPSGFDANNSRKIGGFHNNPDGDILQYSVWDLKFRPICEPEGMVYSPEADIWVDIYLAADDGNGGVKSEFGATILDSTNWMDFVDRGGKVKKRLLTDHEFQLIAAGTPEEVNIYLSHDPVRTGKSWYIKFTGSGLNDLSVDGSGNTLGAGGHQEYEVVIDSEGSPDTFKWRKRPFGGTWGAYTEGVAITGDAQELDDGVTITFGATTGHTLDDTWNIAVANGNRATNGNRIKSTIGVEDATGVMWQWLLDQSYRLDGQSHTHTQTITHKATPTGSALYKDQNEDKPNANLGSGSNETITTNATDPTPSWSWYNLPGAKGSLYRQGTYGDVKLLAGGLWFHGSLAGSRCRHANSYRWHAHSHFGGRFAARRK